MMHKCPLVVFSQTARLQILGGLQRRVVGPPRGAASPVKERKESIGGQESQSAIIKCLTL